MATQTGLRVSELTGLRNKDVELGAGANLRCTGKGRKQRCTPLNRESVAVLRTWTREAGGDPDDPLFPTRQGTRLSRDAVGDLVNKHTATARRTCPSLASKKVTPHVLRHSCAMELLRSGIDRMVMALWLGHEKVETTSIYVHGDLSIKERALARTTPVRVSPGRYRPPDKLLAFLTSL